MKKRFISVVVLTMLLVMMSICFAGSSKAEVISLGDDHLTIYIPADADNELGDGPQSFAIKNNQIYVLDTLDDAIKVFSFHGDFVKTIRYNGIGRGIDLLLLEDSICVLNNNNTVFTMDYKGVLKDTSKLDGDRLTREELVINGKKVTRNFKAVELKEVNNAVEVIYQNGNAFNMTDQVYLSKKMHSRADTVMKNLTIKSTELVGDGNCSIAEKIYQDSENRSSLKIVIEKKHANSNDTEYYTYKRAGLIMPNGDSFITEDHDIYQMIVVDDGITIEKLISSPQNKVNQEVISNSNILESDVAITGSRSSEPARTRNGVYNLAYEMIDYSWVYNKADNGTESSSQITLPSYLRQYSDSNNHTVTGIPYCWGGLDSMNSHSDGQSWSDFPDAVANNKLTGNVHTSGHYYIGGTAGIDCSGFVSASYGFNDNPKLGVSGIFSKFNTITTPSFMDAIKVPGHIMLFEATSAESDYKGIWVLDSSTGEGKTNSQWRSYQWLNDRNVVYGEYKNISN